MKQLLHEIIKRLEQVEIQAEANHQEIKEALEDVERKIATKRRFGT